MYTCKRTTFTLPSYEGVSDLLVELVPLVLIRQLLGTTIKIGVTANQKRVPSVFMCVASSVSRRVASSNVAS